MVYLLQVHILSTISWIWIQIARTLQKTNGPSQAGCYKLKMGFSPFSDCFSAALIISYFTTIGFRLALMCYLLLTLSYSLVLKQYVIIDVLTLASLYTIRIIAGTFLLDVELSFWLLAFSMFLFLSLALVKRCTEIKMLIANNLASMNGRDYAQGDYILMQTIGITSAFLAVLVLALFIQTTFESNIYHSPMLLWLIFSCFYILDLPDMAENKS